MDGPEADSRALPHRLALSSITKHHFRVIDKVTVMFYCSAMIYDRCPVSIGLREQSLMKTRFTHRLGAQLSQVVLVVFLMTGYFTLTTGNIFCQYLLQNNEEQHHSSSHHTG